MEGTVQNTKKTSREKYVSTTHHATSNTEPPTRVHACRREGGREGEGEMGGERKGKLERGEEGWLIEQRQ